MAESAQVDMDGISDTESRFVNTDSAVDPEIEAAIKAEETIMEEATEGITQTSRELFKSVRLRRRPVTEQED
jgi:hypothetical protein